MQAGCDPYFTATDKAKPRQPSGIGPLVARIVLRAGVVVFFTGLLGLCVGLYDHGYPRLVATIALIGFMAAAALAGHSWRERVALALSVPFFVAGGAAGFLVYLGLFSFRWFEAIFNDKGSGPLGLLIFVCGFAVAGGLGGAWVLERAFGLRRRPGRPPA